MSEQILEKFCTHCEAWHLETDFPFRSEVRKDGTRRRAAICLAARKAKSRAAYLRPGLEARRAKIRECHARTTEKRLAYNQNYAKEHKEEQDAYFKRWREQKRDDGYFRTPEKRAKMMAYRLGSKLRVFNAYGGPVCACCGETELDMLTLDHIAGDGAAHRSMWPTGQKSSQRVYRWVIANGFPGGFQILCQSCNMGKHRSGVNKCPHQLQVDALWQSFIDYATPMAA